MANATTPVASVETTAPVYQPALGHKSVWLPYVLAIAAQLPLLLYYFSTLWARPHYQFFPFALIVVGVFAYTRWPRNLEEPFFARKLSPVLFWAGIVFGIAGALFATAWFSAASLVLLMTSLFAMTRDGEVAGKTLLVLGLPLLIILMPPNNLDFRLITVLQQISAKVSSWYLDVLNFKHYSPGTTLNFPHQHYEVERACSGVQSFFTLMFCTSFLIVSLRRPWFRATLLLISAAFWAVFMNSVRILVIPIADIVFGIDLIEGLSHDLLGYIVLLVAIGMILSTDQLMEFVFGRSGQKVNDESRPGALGRLFGKSSSRQSGQTDQASRYKPVPAAFRRLTLAASIVMLMFGGLQFYDFIQSVNQPRKMIRFFSGDVIVDLDERAMPETIDSATEDRAFQWAKFDYRRADRTRGSDLGQRSDTWRYVSKTGVVANASIDQTFPGWHELTTCYKNMGYVVKRGGRQKKSATYVNQEGETVEWQYVQVDMEEPTTGKRGLLLFSFTDPSGRPFDAPVDWGNIRSFVERAKNRLSYNVRSTLFRGEAYQLQVFVESPRNFDEARREEIVQQYLQTRLAMRSALLNYANDNVSEDPADGEEPDEEEPAADEPIAE